MRPLFLVLPISLLCAPQAGAQSGNYPVTDDTPISTVQVKAQPSFRIWDYQADAVSGTYELSNGWRLKVRPARDGVVARIDSQRPIALVALSPDKFASRDGNVIMEFNQGDYREDMRMSYVPGDAADPRLAQVIVVTAKMAQR